MGQFFCSVFSYRNQVTAVALGLALVFMALASLPVQAQSGCTGDPCVFNTPTGTSTSTPRPTPGPGTPTPVPMPSAQPFPRPNYGIPTSIPGINFSTVPNPIEFSFDAPTPEPWLTPEALDMPAPLSLTQTTGISLNTISTDLAITYSTPLSLNAPITNSSGFTFVTGLNGDGRAIISEVVSYTDYLSGQVASLQYTDTLTITAAPDWYAPYMPREMANIGWTFEQVGQGSTARYSLDTWAYLFGAMVAMPIRLSWGVWDLFRFLGPFGLFMIWLIIVMLPAVMGFKILLFIKNTFIRLINFALTVIDWILKLWQAIPWYLGGPG